VVKIRSRGEKVRSYVLEHVAQFPHDIAKKTSQEFRISRQAVNKHLKNLVDEKVLMREGKTRQQTYHLCPRAEHVKVYTGIPRLEEDVVWRNDVLPLLDHMPANVLDIWSYGFTEMFNNVIDHSNASQVSVHVKKAATTTEIWVLELSKGKLTTDPTRHTGEGIFFSSRMFDQFRILSTGTHFSHQFGDEDNWVFESADADRGTAVLMNLNNHTARSAKKVFAEFSSGDDIGFTKTVVPVRLAQYGNDKLMSRSQAKRLLDRVDRFKTVLFDFSEVDTIGQAFADEIFRVFRNTHPNMKLHAIHASAEIKALVNRAQLADPLPQGE
jgi:STAS-like domain of unknown function (DUF4325)